VADIWPRLRIAILLALITGLWCWLLTALHGIWSFGIVHEYLYGGRIPFSPTFPVTYGSFFIDALGAFAAPFLLLIIVCAIVPRQYHLMSVILGWLIGAWIGASNISFMYQIDFGTTWGPFEAFRALFFHPIVTPFWLIFGVLGTVSLTRPVRGRP